MTPFYRACLLERHCEYCSSYRIEIDVVRGARVANRFALGERVTIGLDRGVMRNKLRPAFRIVVA